MNWNFLTEEKEKRPDILNMVMNHRGFIIFAVFLGYLSNCWLVKKNFATWSRLVSWLVMG